MFDKRTSAQASIPIILILGLIAIESVISGLSLNTSAFQTENIQSKSLKALYASWAGVDEIMYRLRAKQSFTDNYSIQFSLTNGSTVSAQIVGDENKTITSQGYFDGAIKRLEIVVASSSSKASFTFAAQSGDGGFELEGSTSIVGKNNTDGNVYSNGDVLGIRATSGTSGSKILGNVWAVGYIGGLNTLNSGGVYIKKNARGNSLTACSVGANVYAPIPPSNCPYAGQFTIASPPSPAPLNSVDASYWKNKAQQGTAWSGSCNIMAGDGTDCSEGTRKIGNIVIDGDLNLPSGTNLTITNTTWIKGDINISQNNTLYTDEAVGKDSIVVVASDPVNPNTKGRISTSSNVQYSRNSQGAGLIFISENTGMNCDNDPAVNLTSNTATVVFVAQSGCIKVGTNSMISGILGRKVHISNNSSIVYDPSLAKAIVLPDSGGWAVVSAREY